MPRPGKVRTVASMEHNDTITGTTTHSGDDAEMHDDEMLGDEMTDDEGDGDVSAFATEITAEEFEDLRIAAVTRTGHRRGRSTGRPVWEPGDCDACQYAAEHGWWGNDRPGRSHCRSCHRYWNSLNEGHCTVCCRHFATSAAFDAHLVKTGCVDPDTVVKRDGSKRFHVRRGRFGDTWALVNYRELPDFAAMRKPQS